MIFSFGKVCAQQNHSMYFMHYLPESNLLNPAVPISCKWYVGLPALSSMHFNYGNSSFTYKELLTPTGTGTFQADIDGFVDQLHWRNYIGTELHVQLFGIGYRKGNYSFMFNITEKNNIPIIFPKSFIEMAWEGNTLFEGQSPGLKGTGVYFNHYREYALSASKSTDNGLYFGGRAKLLFGKLNTSFASTDISLTTDETTFNLHLQGEVDVRTSLPVIVDATDNRIQNISYNDALSPLDLILNRKNPGFAIDLGVIYPYTDKIELSASVLDLGFIRWRSNLNTFYGSGEFIFEGLVTDTLIAEDYLSDMLGTFQDSLNFTITQDKYTTFLPPRFIVGGTYQINNWLKFGAQGEAIIHRSKVITSATLSAHVNPVKHFQFMASYSIQYYNLKALGAGFVIGRNPVQFYMLTDNLIGTIWPMSTRNINLRFGLNINLGCKIREKEDTPGTSGKGMLSGNCYWIEKSIQKKIRQQNRNKK